MSFRLCVSTESGLLQLEDPDIWANGQVNAKTLRFSGATGTTADLIMKAVTRRAEGVY